MVVDYKEEVKRLISQNYAAADMLSKEFEMTTGDIVDYLRNIMPKNAVDAHLVYEALKELNFEPQEKSPLEYFWFFKRANP